MQMVGQRAPFMAPLTTDSTLSGPPVLQHDDMKCGYITLKAVWWTDIETEKRREKDTIFRCEE